MVRVLCCHHFYSQDVLSIANGPLCMCSSQDSVYLANEVPGVDVIQWDTDRRNWKVTYSFPCLAPARKICYSNSGGYVMLLEEQQTRSEKYTVVRCYFNWTNYNRGQPMKVIIASQVTNLIDPTIMDPASLPEHLPFLIVEVSEPGLGDVSSISTCSVSQRMAVAFEQSVSVYEPRSTGPLQDMVKMFVINFPLMVCDVVLCRNMCAVCSNHHVHVVDTSQQHGLGAYETEKQAERSSDNTGVDGLNLGTETTVVSTSNEDIPTLHIPSIRQRLVGHKKKPAVYYGPCTPPSYLQSTVTQDEEKRICTLLLHKKVDTEYCICYMQFVETNVADEHPSYSLYVSTSKNGFLYNVSARPVTRSAVYQYTVSAKKAVVGKKFVHAATQVGLETFTSRTIVSALVNNNCSSDERLMLGPLVGLEPCMVSLQPFIGLQDITVIDDQIVLLSKDISSHGGSATLYCLTDQDSISIYKDMLEYGGRHRTESELVYHHLLQEGHLLLKADVTLPGPTVNPALTQAYRNSCVLMGDHYASQMDSTVKYTVPYYMASKYCLSDVILHFQSKALTKWENYYNPGFLAYLEESLYLEDSQVQLTKEVCDVVLDIYSCQDKQKLALLLLKNVLRTSDKEKVIQILRVHDLVSSVNVDEPERYLAMAVLYLERCELEEASAALAHLTMGQKVALCSRENQVLCLRDDHPSPLAQLLRSEDPTLFIDIMVHLLADDIIQFDESVKLFQHDNMELHKNNQLMIYLEAILRDLSLINYYEGASKYVAQIYIEKLVHWSPPSSRTAIPAGHSHPSKCGGHFGQRYSWLDGLPPLTGVSRHQPCQYIQRTASRSTSMPLHITKTHDDTAVCRCCCCCEDLIKLQSLLCYEYSSRHKLTDTVKNSLEKQETFKGRDSIKLLCSIVEDRTAAIDSLVDAYPQIIAQFADQACSTADLSDWKHLVEVVGATVKHLQITKQDVNMCKEYLDAYKDILVVMSGKLNPHNFVNILPADGLASFFIPYIELNINKHKAKRMKSDIVDKGTQLLI